MKGVIAGDDAKAGKAFEHSLVAQASVAGSGEEIVFLPQILLSRLWGLKHQGGAYSLRFDDCAKQDRRLWIRLASWRGNSRKSGGPMLCKNYNESWLEVCAQVAREPDPRKLIKLIRELCLLLDAKHQRVALATEKHS